MNCLCTAVDGTNLRALMCVPAKQGSTKNFEIKTKKINGVNHLATKHTPMIFQHHALQTIELRNEQINTIESKV